MSFTGHVQQGVVVFDEPIALDDGATLRTLRDAIQYLGKTVPKGR